MTTIDKKYSDKLKKYDNFEDFLKIEIYEIIRESGLFDEDYYYEKYPHVKQFGWNPYAHYVHIGIYEKYKPNKFFDSDWYLDNYPDVKESNIKPFLHYILWGKQEGRCQNIDELKKNNNSHMP